MNCIRVPLIILRDAHENKHDRRGERTARKPEGPLSTAPCKKSPNSE